MEFLEEELIDEANALGGGNVVGYMMPPMARTKNMTKAKADAFFPDKKGKKIKTDSESLHKD